ncbi:MAG: hypothetical protein DRQ51_10405, partial [Gammaproteobacteria bacterium]
MKNKIAIEASLLLVALLITTTGNTKTLVGSLEGGANNHMGVMNYTLPIETPKGVNKLTPNIGLNYSSSTGGGFNLSGLSNISRCVATKDIDGFDGNIQFNADDRFCLDGKRLIKNSNSNYNTQQITYNKITTTGGNDHNPEYWQIFTKDGFILYYGKENNSKNTHPNGKTITWFLNKKQDRFGNQINYLYEKKYHRAQIDEIKYSIHTIKFNKEPQPSLLAKYQYGRAYYDDSRLQSINIYSNENLKRSYKISYKNNNNNVQQLSAVTLCDGNNNCLKPTKFTYYPKDNIDPMLKDDQTIHNNNKFLSYHLVDVTGDGKNNVCYYSDENMVCDGVKSPIISAQSWLTYNPTLRRGIVNSLQFVDINFDGFVDYCFNADTGLNCAINQQNLKFRFLGVRSPYGMFIKRPNPFVSTDPPIVSKPNEKIFFQNINQDDYVDLCKLTSTSIDCSLNDGQGKFTNDKQIKNSGFANPKETFMVDINGDRLQDICQTNQNNYFVCYLNTSSRGKLSYSNKKIWSKHPHFYKPNDDIKNSLRMTDYNNDGLVDVCYYHGSFIHCAINNGYQFIEINTISRRIANGSCNHDTAESIKYEEKNPNYSPDVYDPNNPSYRPPQTTVYYCNDNNSNLDNGWGAVPDKRLDTFNMLDINHDGKIDACFMPEDGVFSCAFGNGGTLGNMQRYAVFDPELDVLNIAGFGNIAASAQPVRFADINGDSKLDICYRSQAGISCATGDSQGGTGLLKSVSTAFNNTQFFYSNLHNSNTYTSENNQSADGKSLTPSMRVLQKITTNNAAGTTNSINYQYQDLRLHKKNGIRAFSKIIKTTDFNNQKTISHYHQSKKLNGKLEELQTFVNGQLISETSYQYQIQENSNKSYAIYNHQTTANSYDLNGSLLKTKTTSLSNFNKFGDPAQVIERITDNTTADYYQTTTNTDYFHNEQDYIISKPTETTVTHQTNNSPPITRVMTFDYNYQGSLIEQTAQPDSDLSLTTNYQYDNFGNKTQTTITDKHNNRTTYIQYSNNGLFPIKITNGLGYIQKYEYDNFCHKPTQKTDLNSLVANHKYDGLCRLIATHNPDGTTTTISYDFADDYDLGIDKINTSKYKIISQISGKPPQTAYYDGLKNKTRTKKIGFDNKKIILQDTLYNKNSLISQATLPYYQGMFAGDNTSWLKFEYDDLGRKTKQIRLSDNASQITGYSYNGFSATTINPNGNSTTTTTNIQSKTSHVVTADGGTINNSYDALGSLIQVSINGQITNSISYDEMGNKIAMSDKSMGNWSYVYNAFGELTSQKDAKGQVTHNSYDKIGRLVKKQFGNSTNSFIYDTAPNGKGKLHKSISDAKQQTISYDKFGRTANIITTIDEQEYSQSFEYDKFSRPTKTIHPNNIQINKNYNQAGFLKSISMPKKQVWTPDLVSLEKVMQTYMNKAQELDKEATKHEDQALKYMHMASKARNAYNHYTRVANSQQNYANRLRALAKNNDSYARSYLRTASYWRSQSNKYYRIIGDRHMRLISVASNGWARYYHYKKVKRGKRTYRYRYNWYLKGFFSRYSYPRYLHIGRLFTKYSSRYEGYANSHKRAANSKRSTAARYDSYARANHQRAQSFKNQSLHYNKIASFYTTKMRQIKEQKENYQRAADIISENLDQFKAGLDDSQIMLWSATNLDASNRVAGQIYGNGILTQHTYD